MTDTAAPAQKTPRYWYEDFPVGKEWALTPVTLTRESIIAFARDYDPQPFHLDDAAGEASLFGALAASGWQTCALAHRMLCDVVILDMAGLGSPGVDNIKWLKPVLVGDTIAGRAIVTEARLMKSRPGIGLVCVRTEIVNQKGELVLTMSGWTIIRQRRAAPAS